MLEFFHNFKAFNDTYNKVQYLLFHEALMHMHIMFDLYGTDNYALLLYAVNFQH
jgi:hypothetical protein